MRKIKVLAGRLIIALIPLVALAFSGVGSGDLPPRPATPTPVVPTSTPERSGGRIILQQTGTELFPTGAWAVVQWQNESGRWYDVDGWQGTFNSTGQIIWWIGSEHLGSGPFRWQVYDAEARTALLATSEPFDLPSQNGETVTIDLALSDAAP